MHKLESGFKKEILTGFQMKFYPILFFFVAYQVMLIHLF